MRELLSMYAAFFRIGLFTFGGGYAMLPMMEREAVEKYHWVTHEEVLDLFSMSQCTPGVIAVNAATFIGAKQRGFIGALCTTLGVITPSIIIITLIAALFGNYSDIPAVAHAFSGIRIVVAALIFGTVIKMFKDTVKSRAQLFVCIFAFIAVAFFGVSPVIVIFASGLYGFFFINLENEDKHKKEQEEKNKKKEEAVKNG